jgi:mRNA interferase MazF
LKRGDLVTVALLGDYGKPRPALVVQSDFIDTTSSVVVLLLTSTLSDTPMVRIAVDPSDRNGLRTRSQIQIDKIFSVSRAKVGPTIGHLDEDTMAKVAAGMVVFLAIA